MRFEILYSGTLSTSMDGDFPYTKYLDIKRDGTAVVTNADRQFKFSHYGVSPDRLSFRAAEFVCRWKSFENEFGTNYLFFKSRETISNIIPFKRFYDLEIENLIGIYDAEKKLFIYKFQYNDHGTINREWFVGTKAYDESTNSLNLHY